MSSCWAVTWKEFKRLQVRDWLRQRQQQAGIPHWYRNGDVGHFGAIGTFLEIALSGLMQHHSTMFRAPRSLEEWRRVARTLVSATGNLYRSYYAGAVPHRGRQEATLTTVLDSQST